MTKPIHDLITVDNVIGDDECDEQAIELLRDLLGSGKTALEVLDLPESESVRLGMLFRSGVMPKVVLDEFAVRYAEHILQWWWQHNPEYVKKRYEYGDAIKRWKNGESTEEELGEVAKSAWRTIRVNNVWSVLASRLSDVVAQRRHEALQKQIDILRDIITSNKETS